MGKQELIVGFRGRYSQIVSNLKSWSFFEWIFFFVLVPLLLFLVYLLPQNFKDTYLVFNTSELFRIQTFLVNEYTHSSFDHILGNVKFYLIAILVIFAFENNKQRFRIMVSSAFLIVPIVAAFLTVIFWSSINRNTVSQGFSGIGAALSAYAIMVFLFWAMHDVMPLFKQSKKFTIRQYPVYIIMCILVAATFILVIVFGLQLGMFIEGGGAVSNGIAHFGGFITGLIVFLLCDLIPENRSLNLDVIFGLSIIIGIYVYIPYLLKIVDGIKNGVG
ncbi:MAG: hypothetical protein NT058_01660 [Candidatus Portnoybacteria bacterium]|nr:hypothetical protein [Candidatus Portnoybacteria bacterium]